jgi:hypothetical protein
MLNEWLKKNYLIFCYIHYTFKIINFQMNRIKVELEKKIDTDLVSRKFEVKAIIWWMLTPRTEDNLVLSSYIKIAILLRTRS